MNINNYLNQFNLNNLKNFNDLLDDAKPFISLSGNRMLSVKGYEGSVAIDCIAKKIFYICKNKSYLNLSMDKRIEGIKLSDRLIQFYENTESKLKKKSCCSRVKILSEMRDLFTTAYTTRFFVMEGKLSELFRTFSEDTYIKIFGKERNNDGLFYKNSDGMYFHENSPSLIRVKRDAIWEKLTNV